MSSDNLPGVDPSIVIRLPYSFAKSKGVIAARAEGDGLELWVRGSGPSTVTIAEIRRALGKPLWVIKLSEKLFDDAFENAYSRGSSGDSQVVLEDMEQSVSFQKLASELPRIADLLESGDDAPVIRLVNSILLQALNEKASDIHFEHFEERSVVRLRKDGVLSDILELKAGLHTAITSRVKVMANLDIDVKRTPQDGRIALRLGGRSVDVRVSTLPTSHGERIVLRLHDKQEKLKSLERLGMSGEAMQTMEELIHRRHGIILVTGPTGSGKTTTLYAAISRMNIRKMNIMTVEDPVEYEINGIGQTQVNPKIEMSFAKALRSILRQDPDVIMIGEVRDLETARIAVQASLTGHLVLATLHTNDSVGSITRLVDMGVEPFLLSSSVLAVLAQRLVRCLCMNCRYKIKPDLNTQSILESQPEYIYTATGCKECHETGYKGRVGLFELLVIDDKMRQLIHDGKSESMLRNYAVNESNMVTLKRDGMRLVSEGVTSLEEALLAVEGVNSASRNK